MEQTDKFKPVARDMLLWIAMTSSVTRCYQIDFQRTTGYSSAAVFVAAQWLRKSGYIDQLAPEGRKRGLVITSKGRELLPTLMAQLPYFGRHTFNLKLSSDETFRLANGQ